MPSPLFFPEYMPAFIASLEQAIAVDPEFADAYGQLAFGHWGLRNREIAGEYAQKAIELDPTLSQAYSVLGLTYEHFYVRQDEARAAYERAVELSPNDPQILIRNGSRLAELTGDYAHAIRFGDCAIAIDPNDASLYDQLGFIYLRAGDLPEAARYLKEAIRLDPGAYNHYLDLATFEYLNGNRIAARDNLDRTVQIMASSAIQRVGYVPYLYGLLGETDQAVELLAQLEQAYADRQREIWPPLGWAVLGTGDKAQAIREWTITVDGYLDENRRIAPGRISRFRDN